MYLSDGFCSLLRSTSLFLSDQQTSCPQNISHPFSDGNRLVRWTSLSCSAASPEPHSVLQQTQPTRTHPNLVTPLPPIPITASLQPLPEAQISGETLAKGRSSPLSPEATQVSISIGADSLFLSSLGVSLPACVPLH